MSFEVLLIRHGQSANNAEIESRRVPDPGLTSVGKQQADHVAEWLATYPPTILYCSAFLRSLETTRPIAAKTKLVPNIQSDIYELGGCYEGYIPGQMKPHPGMGRSSLTAAYPGWPIDERITENGWYHGQPLEVEDACRSRAQTVGQWLTTFARQHSHAREQDITRFALVIHADFKALLIDSLLGVQSPILSPFRDVPNTSVTQLSWIRGQWMLDFWCSISHLPGRLITR